MAPAGAGTDRAPRSTSTSPFAGAEVSAPLARPGFRGEKAGWPGWGPASRPSERGGDRGDRPRPRYRAPSAAGTSMAPVFGAFGDLGKFAGGRDRGRLGPGA